MERKVDAICTLEHCRPSDHEHVTLLDRSGRGVRLGEGGRGRGWEEEAFGMTRGEAGRGWRPRRHGILLQ